MLEIQARLLAKMLEGEIGRYPAFVTVEGRERWVTREWFLTGIIENTVLPNQPASTLQETIDNPHSSCYFSSMMLEF